MKRNLNLPGDPPLPADMTTRIPLGMIYPSQDPGQGWNIPANKDYPTDAGQCDDCGGWGCATCLFAGWLPAGHPKIRKCAREGCNHPVAPACVAVYCSDECADEDA